MAIKLIKQKSVDTSALREIRKILEKKPDVTRRRFLSGAMLVIPSTLYSSTKGFAASIFTSSEQSVFIEASFRSEIQFRANSFQIGDLCLPYFDCINLLQQDVYEPIGVGCVNSNDFRYYSYVESVKVDAGAQFTFEDERVRSEYSGTCTYYAYTKIEEKSATFTV